MVNTQLLDKKLEESGYKISFVCAKLGISRQAFNKKKNNFISFKVSEMFTLCELLNLTDFSDAKSIFFN